MRRLLLAAAFLFAAFVPAQETRKFRAEDQDRRFKKWLEEDVVYIVTPEEKAVFQRLTEQLKADKQYHELFDALLMRARHGLGLQVILTTSMDDLSEPVRAQLEEAYLDACREVGVKTGEFHAARRVRELHREAHVLVRQPAVLERRPFVKTGSQNRPRVPVLGLGRCRPGVDPDDRGAHVREETVRDVRRRGMEGEDRHLDALPLELANLVDDERLRESGKDLDDVAEPAATAHVRRTLAHCIAGRRPRPHFRAAYHPWT